jgi:hypothetical protein
MLSEMRDHICRMAKRKHMNTELQQANAELLETAKKMVSGPGQYNYKTVAVERMKKAIERVEAAK